MRVLMFGWEFPPHIAGGLGTACEGIVKGLAHNGVEVLFVMPSASGDEDQSCARIINASDVAVNNVSDSVEEFINKVKFINVDSSLVPYVDPSEYYEAIEKMKDNVILVNTSRGALISSEDLIRGIRQHKFAGVGLDVYEEEDENVFENRENEILETSITARLLSFPNVIITSHQGFLTAEALESISLTTLQNAMSFKSGNPISENVV